MCTSLGLKGVFANRWQYVIDKIEDKFTVYSRLPDGLSGFWKKVREMAYWSVGFNDGFFYAVKTTGCADSAANLTVLCDLCC